MFRTDKLVLYAAGVLATVVFLYGLPTLVESYCLGRLGPFTACVLLGNLLGCMVLAAISWKRALALYVSLAILEFVLLRFGVISSSSLLWLTDIIPTFLVTRLTLSLVDVVATRAEE